MGKFLVVGNLSQDIYLSQIPGLELDYKAGGESFNRFRVGDHLVAGESHILCGGTASNVSVALSKWGQSVDVLSILGKDAIASQLLARLDEFSVGTSLIVESEKSSSYNIRLYDRGIGRQTIISYLADWSCLTGRQLNLGECNYDWAYVATVDGEFKLLDELFHQLKRSNVKIMFNPGRAELTSLKKCWGLFEDTDILLVNRSEAELVTQDTNLENSAHKLATFVPLAVVTDSLDGVIVADSQRLWRAGVYEVAPVVDRNGVGDAFGAGFLFAYAKSGRVDEAIVRGSANASAVLPHLGAQTGILAADAAIEPIVVRERKLS